jgi:hypothetical protein
VRGPRRVVPPINVAPQKPNTRRTPPGLPRCSPPRHLHGLSPDEPASNPEQRRASQAQNRPQNSPDQGLASRARPPQLVPVFTGPSPSAKHTLLRKFSGCTCLSLSAQHTLLWKVTGCTCPSPSAQHTLHGTPSPARGPRQPNPTAITCFGIKAPVPHCASPHTLPPSPKRDLI